AHLGLEGVAVLLARLAIFALGQQLLVLQRRLARVGDDVALEVEDLLEFLQRHVEQRADSRRQRAQEPDVRDGRSQVDMAHPLAADLRLDYFNAALLADDAAMAHALVLAAVALVVLGRPENLGAEQPVALRLEGPVVDRFGLLDLAVRPRADHFRRRDRNADRVERQWILGLFENAEEIFHLYYNSWPLSPLRLLEQLHVQAERLELLDHNVERLGQSGLERVLALDDRFVHPRSSRHVVGFNREHFLQRVGGAVSLERPHFHLSQALAAELRLAAERLLRDQAVGSGRPRVNLSSTR